jgi:hypothetical protein
MIISLHSATRLRKGFALAFLLLATVVQAEPTPAPKPDVDPLAEALPLLQTGYVDFAKLQATPKDHLADLVTRSAGGISVDPTTAPAVSVPILTALLAPDTIYCRLSSFAPAAGWADFTSQLDKWLGASPQGIVLDLRSNGAPDDFDGAARVAGFFMAAGAPLFTIQDAQGHSHNYVSSGPDPLVLTQPIAVLIDHRTAGAAEALAACLRDSGALLIGEKTMGRGALFTDAPLSGGQTLRYATGRVLMADGTSLWNNPVVPDICLPMDDKKEQAVLGLIGQNRIAEVIQEASRSHRLSEAALVRGEDPEIEAYLPSTGKKQAGAPQDIVLVNALDGLTAIRLSRRTPDPAAAEVASPEIPSAVQ